MAPAFGVINDLQPGKSKIGLQLRLVHCYEVSEFNNRNQAFSLECVFHDKLGDRVHASIHRSLISKFKSLMDEGKVYVVYNYVVGNNTMNYKTTGCRFKLLFFKQTKICDVSDDSFPSQIFNFKPFNEIASMENTSDDVMFDVLGVIVSTYKPQIREINGRQIKLMDFVLEDIEHNTLACTLWKNYAEELTEFLLKEPACPVGVIIQFLSPKVDIFSLGASIYELVKGSPLPESGPHFLHLREGKLPLLPGHSIQFQNLIKAMMDADPVRRPSARELVQNPIFGRLQKIRKNI